MVNDGLQLSQWWLIYCRDTVDVGPAHHLQIILQKPAGFSAEAAAADVWRSLSRWGMGDALDLCFYSWWIEREKQMIGYQHAGIMINYLPMSPISPGFLANNPIINLIYKVRPPNQSKKDITGLMKDEPSWWPSCTCQKWLPGVEISYSFLLFYNGCAQEWGTAPNGQFHGKMMMKNW